jgi:hypothetical protein
LRQSRKYLIVLILSAVVIVGLAFAQIQWHIISDLFQGQTSVTNSLLHIYPCSITPFPSSIEVGEAFQILIDVDNPNPTTVNGQFMINFTKTGIAVNDVSVTSNATYNGSPVLVTSEGISGSTSIFTVKVNNSTNQYFQISPGQNVDITWIYIQYNTAGTYQYSLAVIQ